jgi:hypothetical protein
VRFVSAFTARPGDYRGQGGRPTVHVVPASGTEEVGIVSDSNVIDPAAVDEVPFIVELVIAAGTEFVIPVDPGGVVEELP